MDLKGGKKMNTTKNYNIQMVRGDTLAFSFEVEGIDSLDTAYFTCKTNVDENEFIFQKSLNNGISLVENGRYRVRVAPSDTANIEVGSYYYDLEIGANSDIFTILKGKLKIDADITRGV